jgi:hypothetical protein
MVRETREISQWRGTTTWGAWTRILLFAASAQPVPRRERFELLDSLKRPERRSELIEQGKLGPIATTGSTGTDGMVRQRMRG